MIFYLSINVFAFLTFPRYSYFKFMLNILLACIHLICLIAILKYYSKTMFLVLNQVLMIPKQYSVYYIQ
jgi:hypothetical protein